MSDPQVVIVPDTDALADEAAERIERVCLDAPTRDRINIALAGGGTPRVAYRHLAGRCPPWARVEFFFGDERMVPPDDEGSNYRMAREALLDRAPLTDEQIHRIPGEEPPEEAARIAERELRAVVPDDPWPILDLVILGVGPDGHTASLFPGAPELEVDDRAMVAVHRPDLPQPWRVSMTLPVINAARRVLFLVSGREKAEVAARAIAGDEGLPAGRVRPEGELTWIVTADAAAGLPAPERDA